MMIIALTIQIAIIIILGTFMYLNIKKVIRKAYMYQVNVVQEKKEGISFKDSLLKISAPVINVKVGDKKYGFLIDTGADRNYFDSEAFKDLNIEASDDGVTVATANGIVNTLSTSIPFKIKNNKFEEKFGIIPISENIAGVLKGTDIQVHGILGSSFFKDNRWKLDFENMVIWTK